MSVKGGLLAVLTLGPAYGHQLHSELARRAPHRGPVNVGQIYTTIERLTRQKLVAQSGSTADGLPLYRLTESGRVAATTEMTAPSGASSADWTEMLDQVLIASSIDPSAARALADLYRTQWTGELEDAGLDDTGLDNAGPFGRAAAVAARRELAGAAVSWLTRFIAEAGDDAYFGYADVRPRRGRRPGPTAPAPSARPTDDSSIGDPVTEGPAAEDPRR